MHVDTRVGVEITVDEVLEMPSLRGGTGGSSQAAREMTREAARRLVPEANALLEPAVIYDVLDVKGVGPERIVFDGGLEFHGKLFGKLIEKAQQALLGVVTAGPRLEQRAAELFAKGDPFGGMILDQIGTLAVELLMKRVFETARSYATERNMKVSLPFSPGESPLWKLGDQKVIFSRLPARLIGVSLSDTNLMRPVKSTSLLIGMGEHLPDPPLDPCKFCPVQKTCQYRKERFLGYQVA